MTHLHYDGNIMKEPPEECFIIISKGQSGMARAHGPLGSLVYSDRKDAERELEKYPKAILPHIEIRRVMVFEVEE